MRLLLFFVGVPALLEGGYELLVHGTLAGSVVFLTGVTALGAGAIVHEQIKAAERTEAWRKKMAEVHVREQSFLADARTWMGKVEGAPESGAEKRE